MSKLADRPLLSDVTLVAVTSVALRATVAALHASMRQADFAEVLLLSDQPPLEAEGAIHWRRIPRLQSRAAYSRFMLRDLVGHISTGHALCIQWDGFVVNGGGWQPEFLEYDYIGAVWPHFTDGHNVGNGGFSLRSRRLLRACKDLPTDDDGREDLVIGRLQRPRLEQMGIRFAPASLARLFSYEREQPTGREFGFHGAFNLVRYLDRGAAARLFESLENGMIARNERWELFTWALSRGQLALAISMLRRLFR